MAYTLELFHKTGYNAGNIPATIDVLRAVAQSVTNLELQIVQNFPLTYIDIPGTFEELKDVDYAKLGDYLFAVTPEPMPANDVVRINITMNPITSFEGQFDIIAGVTERTTEYETDAIGDWTESDPLLTPIRPLEVEYKTVLSDWATTTVVVSDIDFTQAQAVGTSTGGAELTFPAKTFTDPYDDTQKVTTPYTPGNDVDTTFHIGTTTLPSNPGTRLFSVEAFDRVKGILRSLGLEGSVSSYVLPVNGTTFTSETKAVGGQDMLYYTDVTATGSTAEAFDPNYADVKHKRILYGEYEKWGLLTASNSKSEFNVEDIIPPGYTEGNLNVVRVNDLRPDGKPYFRFQYYLKTAPEVNDPAWYIMAAPGAPWQNTPIMWTGASGSWITTQNFNYKLASEAGQYVYNQNNLNRSYNRAVWDIVRGNPGQESSFSPSYQKPTKDNPVTVTPNSQTITGMGIFSNILASSSSDIISYNRKTQDAEYTFAYNRAQYRSARDNELLNYGYSQSVVAPELSFSYQGNLIREVMGNGCVVYRYKYSDYDLKRIDTLLTMYGYRITRPIKITDLFPTDKASGFTYTQAQGISIHSDTLPKWAVELIEAQIGTGVRIWWEKPNRSAYEES